MSGSYVQSELSAEFGRMPPCFLPLGNKRLFHHQIKLAPEECKVYVSIPEDFTANNIDLNWLKEHDVGILETPPELSLGEALTAALNLIEEPFTSPLHILFGDTLFKKLPTGDNVIAVSTVKDNYRWSSMGKTGIDWVMDVDESKNVVSGYFIFNNPQRLIRNITQEKWSFIKGIDRYNNELGLSQVKVDTWYDFGHINTYYHSKAEFTTERSFNELKINNKFIEKSSVKNRKIQAEANWFSSLPYSLRGYIPQYLGSSVNEKSGCSYRLEYLHNTALNELYVFSEIPNMIWNNILDHCIGFLKDCSLVVNSADKISQNIEQLFLDKTLLRLEEYIESKGFNATERWIFNEEQSASIEEILKVSEQYLPTKKQYSTVMHGDFCFSNILYDFRANRIKAIDPRGISPSGDITIYGDINYDIAKLSHSILGLYDWIVAGYHETLIDWDNKKITTCIFDDSKNIEIQSSFIKMIESEFSLKPITLYAMQIQLFLSMLPLHEDDSSRQDGLFANVFRLYKIMRGYE